ncbi:MAG: ornithine cyclodeaminase family protein [Steroidobacteraceae bacterium]|nr:ornithine cyclodeaminase family protein [Steroidobacteraceae bacterium]
MLLLDRQDVAALLPMADCIAAVEGAFRAHAEGALPAAPGTLATPVPGGGFHVKTAVLGPAPGYYAAKINANFPGNPDRSGLPTVQGMIGLFDAADGRPLALLDSIEITTLRTAAASAIAARHLALPDARTLLVCGCGIQGRAHLRALLAVRRIGHVYACDRDPARVAAFIGEFAATGIDIEPVESAGEALPHADVAVTCTPGRQVVVREDDIRPGQFIAAVGADSEGKQELAPRVLAMARVVTDLTAQAAHMGELQHALAAGMMGIGDVHAELGELIAGQRPGRSSPEEIFVFDSTGTALQDVASAAAVYERALATGRGRTLALEGGAAGHD